MPYRKLTGIIDHWANHGVPQMLGTVISVVSIALGFSMWIDPKLFEQTPIFDVVFDYASPYAWGTVYVTTAIAVLVGVFSNQQFAQAPAFIMSVTYAMQGLLVLPNIVDGEIPSPLFLFMGFSWVCLITQVVCGAKGGSLEKGPFRHQP